ncbi:hypothetical protein ACFL21_01005 [Patescibacteria group bacterium]
MSIDNKDPKPDPDTEADPDIEELFSGVILGEGTEHGEVHQEEAVQIVEGIRGSTLSVLRDLDRMLVRIAFLEKERRRLTNNVDESRALILQRDIARQLLKDNLRSAKLQIKELKVMLEENEAERLSLYAYLAGAKEELEKAKKSEELAEMEAVEAYFKDVETTSLRQSVEASIQRAIDAEKALGEKMHELDAAEATIKRLKEERERLNIDMKNLRNAQEASEEEEDHPFRTLNLEESLIDVLTLDSALVYVDRMYRAVAYFVHSDRSQHRAQPVGPNDMEKLNVARDDAKELIREMKKGETV